MPDLVDVETPRSARTRTGFDGKQYDLVFSDEFNTEGRTFYPGQFLRPSIDIESLTHAQVMIPTGPPWISGTA